MAKTKQPDASPSVVILDWTHEELSAALTEYQRVKPDDFGNMVAQLQAQQLIPRSLAGGFIS